VGAILRVGQESAPAPGRSGPRPLPSAAMDPALTPRQVAALQAADQIQLIDVRQTHEHEAGRIAGDRLIELMQLSAQAETIDRERPVVFYCRTGARSAMATQAFRQAGYDAHNMTGGLVEWEAAGLPLDPPGGYVAPG
jgi:rhodanese-related sulfurtransferase